METLTLTQNHRPLYAVQPNKSHPRTSVRRVLYSRFCRWLDNANLSYSRHREALAAYQKALAIWEKLVREHPKVTDYQSNLAEIYAHLAGFYGGSRVGKSLEAVAAQKQALATRERLVRENPNVTKFQRKLALSYRNLAGRYERLGQMAEAIAAYESALAIWERLVRASPDVAEHQSGLADILTRLASLNAEFGQKSDTLAVHKQAIAIWERLARDNPEVLEHQIGLAESLISLAGFHKQMGQLAEALAAHQQALGIRERLAREHPTVTVKQVQLAVSYNNIAVCYRDAGKFAEAALAYDQAVLLLEKNIRENPSEKTYLEILTVTQWHAAPVYLANQQPEKASAVLEDLVNRAKSVAGDKPFMDLINDAVKLRAKTPPNDPGLAILLGDLSFSLLQEKKFARAEPYLRECLEIRKSSVPNDWIYFSTQSMLGSALAGQGKHAEAEPLLLAGYEGIQQRVGTIPEDAPDPLGAARRRIIDFYTAWNKPEQVVAWTEKFAEIDKAISIAAKLREEAKALLEKEDVTAALAKHEEAAALPGQSLDPAAVRDLYARTLQWDKAAAASLKAFGPQDWTTLMLLYAAGRHKEFLAGRKALLTNYQKFQRNDEFFHPARVAVLMPVEEELRDAVRALAVHESAPEVTEDWRQVFVGRLMYRLGEFPEWYAFLPETSPLRKGQDLLAKISNFQQDPSQPNRNALQAAVDVLERNLRYQASQRVLNQYWDGYIGNLALLREGKKALGVPDADQTGANTFKSLELQTQAQTALKQDDWKQALELYEQAAQLPGETIDAAGVRDLYARNLQWNKAADAYLKSLGTTHGFTLHLLFQAERIEEYRAARKQILANQDGQKPEGFYEIAAAVTLTPLDEDNMKPAEQLAENLAKHTVPEIWRQSLRGLLMYRLGRFDEWFSKEKPDMQNRRENRLLSAILTYRNDPSDANREVLQKLSAALQEATDKLIQDGSHINPYWWNYIRNQPYLREAENALSAKPLDEKSKTEPGGSPEGK